MRTPRALIRAIRLWRADRPLPVDLTHDLVSLGYCVDTLENTYRK